jgi:membrane-bound lytic murein transglycosylase D
MKDFQQILNTLAIVESALNPNAISRSGAGGLWQFMKPTARECGLKCGTYVDERMDPEKSTKAAARYLKQLYTAFGNWELVMAAYNAGPGRVRSAVKRSGTSDYWKLARYLPAETQSYVPGFIAASYIMNFHHEHNLIAEYPEHACGELKTVTIYDGMYISELATRSGLTVEIVKGLNPSYVRNYIPSSQTGSIIWLPEPAAELFNSGRIVVPPTVVLGDYINADTRKVTVHGVDYNITTTRKSYSVRSGDNLYDIARKHSCTVSELMSWNKLHSTRLAIGQKLEIRQEVAEIAPVAVIVLEQAPAVSMRNDYSTTSIPSLGLESFFR